MNRTGIKTSPRLSKEMLEAAQEAAPTRNGGVEATLTLREPYEQQKEAVGSMPPPATVRGALKTAVRALAGADLTVLADKLGERLAFERTGCRLYEALLGKYAVHGSWTGGPTEETLRRFHQQELSHFEVLRRALDELGADPTVQTPSADLTGVASAGLIQIVTDPRVNLNQALEAILTAELVDNDGWRYLLQLTRSMNLDELSDRFDHALREEHEHLRAVRDWVAAYVPLAAGAAAVEERPPAG